jgi:UDP-glucuronate 4-epimerase
MAHAYSHLYDLPTTGLRFFTVYGPWGRPDMALFLFTKAILAGESIEVYNNGEMKRDFTYIDDIINGLLSLLDSPPNAIDHWNGQVTDPSSSKASFKLYNIGNNSPVNLMDFINEIEKRLGKKAEINFMPLQPGDVVASHADVSGLVKDFRYKPSITVDEGIREFISWYKEYYNI